MQVFAPLRRMTANKPATRPRNALSIQVPFTIDIFEPSLMRNGKVIRAVTPGAPGPPLHSGVREWGFSACGAFRFLTGAALKARL